MPTYLISLKPIHQFEVQNNAQTTDRHQSKNVNLGEA